MLMYHTEFQTAQGSALARSVNKGAPRLNLCRLLLPVCILI